MPHLFYPIRFVQATAVEAHDKRACQETFFSRMKAFQVLRQPFRHKPVMEKHEACFIAVAVMVQYGIENGSPLFHI